MTPASESDSPTRLARALSFLRGTLAGCADSFTAVEEGWLALTPSLPRVWFGNQLRLRGPLELDALLAAAERHLSGLPYRQVVLEGDGSGLESPLRDRGWQLTRLVVMALARPPSAPSPPAGRADARVIASLDEAQWAEAYRRWHLEDPRVTPEDADQLAAMGLREGRVRGDRRFGVLAGDGRSAQAIASLRGDGGVAQVEDVWTTPEARGRGYARALVTHALLCVAGKAAPAGGAVAAAQPAADHPPGAPAARGPASVADQLTFIVADDEDWPKQLYARLGFAPVGCLWEFHRDPPA